MGEEMEKRIRGEVEEGVLAPAMIRIIWVFWSIGASSTGSELHPSSRGIGEVKLGPGSEHLDR
jgi:hypothetical protein